MNAPSSLAENAGLAFLGETAWAPAQVTDRLARGFLTAVNRCGRPNSDVLRRRLSVVDGTPVETWQIDFPAHFTVQEAALYEQPWAHLIRPSGEWRNPALRPDLRRAIARISRYLATPAAAEVPDWRWIDDPEVLPDASLLVVAREDDFTHGVLSSRIFARWYAAFRATLRPVDRVATFPFPWAPTTPLSSLTAAQEETRHAVARAARAGNPDSLESGMAMAYGWAAEEGDENLVSRLLAAARARS